MVKKQGFKTSLNNNWIDASSNGIPSRRRRAEGSDRLCRAACNAVETATHVVQVCFRTHGGRVK